MGDALTCERCGAPGGDFAYAHRRMRLSQGHADPGMLCLRCASAMPADDMVIELRGYLPFDVAEAGKLPPVAGGYSVVPISSLLAYADEIERLSEGRRLAEGLERLGAALERGLKGAS